MRYLPSLEVNYIDIIFISFCHPSPRQSSHLFIFFSSSSPSALLLLYHQKLVVIEDLLGGFEFNPGGGDGVRLFAPLSLTISYPGKYEEHIPDISHLNVCGSNILVTERRKFERRSKRPTQ